MTIQAQTSGGRRRGSDGGVGGDQLSDVLTALSHPARREILGRLAGGPARFTDVAAPFDVSLNAITKHLRLLERAGLVARERRGREVHLSLRPEPLRLVAGWVHPYEKFWTGRLDALEAHFESRRRKQP